MFPFQLNFKEATNDWSGLIVKLHFYCANKKLIRLNTTDINCIVIKFKGTAICKLTPCMSLDICILQYVV